MSIFKWSNIYLTSVQSDGNFWKNVLRSKIGLKTYLRLKILKNRVKILKIR